MYFFRYTSLRMWRPGRNQLVLLHGFQKKSQKTPKADVELARRRMKGAEETS